jgi:hypothetical protein
VQSLALQRLPQPAPGQAINNPVQRLVWPEWHQAIILVSQWNTTTHNPYNVQQFVVNLNRRYS